MQNKFKKIEPNHVGKLCLIVVFMIAYLIAVSKANTHLTISVDYSLGIPILIVLIMCMLVLFFIPVYMLIAIIFDKYYKYRLFMDKAIYPTFIEYNNACVSIMLFNLPLAAILSRRLIENLNIYNAFAYVLIYAFLFVYLYLMFFLAIYTYNGVVDFELKLEKHGFSFTKPKVERVKQLLKILKEKA